MSAVMVAIEPRLSKQQHSTYIAVIESLLKVTTPAQFIQWVKGELQTLFPHEMFVGGIGHIKRDSIKIERILSAGFPIEYVQAIQRPDGDVSSPIMARWCREQRIEYESNRGQQRSMILRNIKRGLSPIYLSPIYRLFTVPIYRRQTGQANRRTGKNQNVRNRHTQTQRCGFNILPVCGVVRGRALNGGILKSLINNET